MCDINICQLSSEYDEIILTHIYLHVWWYILTVSCEPHVVSWIPHV